LFGVAKEKLDVKPRLIIAASTLRRMNPPGLKKTHPSRAQLIVDPDPVADDDAALRAGQGLSGAQGGRRRQANGMGVNR
jgi:hypothetical protein